MTLNRAKTITAVLATAAGLVLFPATTANAGTTAEGQLIQNAQTGLCLTANYTGVLFTTDCNGNRKDQRWVASIANNNATVFRNVDRNRVLDIYYGKTTTKPRCDCDGQTWNRSTTNWTPVSNFVGGECLDSNDRGEVYSIGCNGGWYQKWGYFG